MSSKSRTQADWTFQSIGQDQDALWSNAAAAKPLPRGTPKADVLKGTNGMDGFYGGDGNDTIYGYGGYDALAGGAGNDKLYGGKGNDNFLFTEKLNAKTNVDTIMDFKASEGDTLSLSRSIFKKIGNSSAAREAAFYVGKKAHDKDDRIIYDKKTGSLYYDPDGTGSAAKIKFAILKNKAALTHYDFMVG